MKGLGSVPALFIYVKTGLRQISSGRLSARPIRLAVYLRRIITLKSPHYTTRAMIHGVGCL